MERVTLLLVLGFSAGCDGRPPLASASVVSGERMLSESNALAAAGLVLTNAGWSPRFDDRALGDDKYLVRNAKDANSGFITFTNAEGRWQGVTINLLTNERRVEAVEQRRK